MQFQRTMGEVRIWTKFFQFTKNPADTPKIFKMIDLMTKYRGQDYFKKVGERLFECPEFKEQFDKGYIPQFPKKETLKEMPIGSLGRTLIDNLEKQGLDLNFFPYVKTDSVIKYLVYRHYLFHDMLHIILEYGTSIIEELALQGFSLAQTASPISGLLISGGMINLTTKEPQNILSNFATIIEGYNHGQRCRQMHSIKFEDSLHLPIEEFRRKFNVAPRFLKNATMSAPGMVH
jgi:ubiquinone biosynthesis protein COQ4